MPIFLLTRVTNKTVSFAIFIRLFIIIVAKNLFLNYILRSHCLYHCSLLLLVMHRHIVITMCQLLLNWMTIGLNGFTILISLLVLLNRYYFVTLVFISISLLISLFIALLILSMLIRLSLMCKILDRLFVVLDLISIWLNVAFLFSKRLLFLMMVIFLGITLRIIV